MSRKRSKRKKYKLPDPVEDPNAQVPHSSWDPAHNRAWDIYKNKFINGHLVDGRSGEAKFYGRGRKGDRSLESMESWEDKKIERDLWRRIRAGERFVEPKKKDDSK